MSKQDLKETRDALHPEYVRLGNLAAFPIEEMGYEQAPDSKVIFGACDWRLTVGDIRAVKEVLSSTAGAAKGGITNDNTAPGIANKAAEEGELLAINLIKKLNDIAMSLAADLVKESTCQFQGRYYLDRDYVCDRLVQWRSEWSAISIDVHSLSEKLRATSGATSPTVKALDELKRYDLVGDYEGGQMMNESDSGDWVYFADAMNFIAADRAARAGASEDEFAALLPGSYYMDPPDGGGPSILEQVSRMAEDARKWRNHEASCAPSAPVGASVATQEFYGLLLAVARCAKDGKATLPATEKLIAHIDQHVASQVRAARDAAIPAGWKLVPLQMTDAMRDVGNEIILDRCKLTRAYKAMLAAAPAISHSGEGAAPVEYKPVGKFLYVGACYEATSSDDPRGITLYRPAAEKGGAA